MNFNGFSKSEILGLYKKSPNTFINFFKDYSDSVVIDAKRILFLYRNAKREADKGLFFDLLQKKISRDISRRDNYSHNTNDSALMFMDEIIDELPKELRLKFGDILVKSFAYAYTKSEEEWATKYKYYSDSSYITKTKFKKMVNKHLDNGNIDVYQLIEISADAIPPNTLRGFVKRIPGGMKDERLKSILRKSSLYCHLGFDKKDLENTNYRRALLRKIAEDQSIAKRLVFPVEFKVSDIRAIKPESRLSFLNAYFTSTNCYGDVKPGGLGIRVKFDRSATYDELESLLFPLVIRDYKHVRDFLSKLKRHYDLKENK